MTLTGDISGISADSRLAFRAYDYASGFDKVGCHVWPAKSTDQEEACGSDAAIIMPGQTVTDDLSNVSAAHIDITAVSTTLSGETLTAVFHLRDVPETLTFDRIGIRPRVLEYHWMISIDIDYEPEQGSAEFDYTLTADHSVLPSDSGKNVAAPIEAKLETDTWEMDGDRLAALGVAIVKVSWQANTITLVGDIPGITSKARFVFEAYDYYDGSDRVSCHVPSAGE